MKRTGRFRHFLPSILIMMFLSFIAGGFIGAILLAMLRGMGWVECTEGTILVIMSGVASVLITSLKMLYDYLLEEMRK